MKFLLDTHILIWAASESKRLPVTLRRFISNHENEPVFSAVSIWEIAIKQARGRPDFQNDPHQLRRNLIDNGYLELPLISAHALALDSLPPLHKDPFDRILIAQAKVEGFAFLTLDSRLLQYGSPVWSG